MPTDRLTDDEIRALLDACAMYPTGDATSIAPLRVGEAVSVLDEVLTLRARVSELTSLVRLAAHQAYQRAVEDERYGCPHSRRADRIADRLLEVPDAG